MGQLPYLEADGLKLPQSLSIARFIARENNLYGKDSLEQAKTDAVVDTAADILNVYFSKVFKAEDKTAAWTAFRDNEATKGLQNLEKLIGLYGGNGFAVGNALTWADLFIYDVTSQLFDREPSVLDNYAAVKQVRASVEAHEKVADYLKNRKETMF